MFDNSTEPPPRELGRYPTAVIVRMNPNERDAMNAAAIAAGLSLQNYCRAKFGLPLPQTTKAPYKRTRKRRGPVTYFAKGSSHEQTQQVHNTDNTEGEPRRP